MSLSSIAESLRNALSLSRQSAAELRAKLAELKAERAHIAGANLPREDVESLLLASLRKQCDAAILDAGIMRELTDLQGQGKYLIDMDASPACHPLYSEVGSTCSEFLLARIMALLSEPESILARMKPAIDAMDWTQCGLSLDKRRAKIQKLDAEISKIELELQGLQAAISATVDVQPIQPSNGPHIGERRCIDGQMATFGAVYPNSPPGWIFDPQ